MLRSILRPVATLPATAGLFYLAFAAAQPPAPQTQAGRQPTIEERVAALERGLASVTTRFELREAAVAPTPTTGAALESRLSGVELSNACSWTCSASSARRTTRSARRIRRRATPPTRAASRRTPRCARVEHRRPRACDAVAAGVRWRPFFARSA